jgi:hypothetical protein
LLRVLGGGDIAGDEDGIHFCSPALKS